MPSNLDDPFSIIGVGQDKVGAVSARRHPSDNSKTASRRTDKSIAAGSNTVRDYTDPFAVIGVDQDRADPGFAPRHPSESGKSASRRAEKPIPAGSGVTRNEHDASAVTSGAAPNAAAGRKRAPGYRLNGSDRSVRPDAQAWPVMGGTSEGPARSAAAWKGRRAPLRLGACADWEPAYSYLGRLAARNAYSAEEFARLFDIRLDAVRQGDEIEIGLLSIVADIDPAGLLRGTPRRVRGGVWNLRGERIGDDFLERERDFVCHVCLAEDRRVDPRRGDSFVRRRVWWDLTPLHRCPEHGCPLEARAGDRHAGPCNILSNEPGASDWESYVLGRLEFCDRIQAELLDVLNMRSVIELVAACGAVAVHGPTCRLPTRDLVRDADVMRLGFTMARTEESYLMLLERLWQNGRQAGTDWSMHALFGRLHLAIARKSVIENALTLMRRFVSERIPSSNARDYLNIIATEEADGSQTRNLALAMRPARMRKVASALGLLDETPPDSPAAAHPATIAEVNGRLEDTIGFLQLRNELGLSDFQLRAVLEHRLIEPKILLPETGEGRYRFAMEAAEIFVARLANGAPVAATPVNDCISVLSVLEARIGILVVANALLIGDVRSTCRVQGTAGLASVFVSKADAMSLKHRLRTDEGALTAEVFANRVGLHVKSVLKLIQIGMIIRSEKKSGYSNVIEYSELDRFDRSYISSKKLGRLLNIGQAGIGKFLWRNYRIERDAKGARHNVVLYRRDDVERAGLIAATGRPA